MVIGIKTTTVVRFDPNTDIPTLSVPLSIAFVTVYRALPWFVS